MGKYTKLCDGPSRGTSLTWKVLIKAVQNKKKKLVSYGEVILIRNLTLMSVTTI